MKNGAPCHTAKATQNWLNQNRVKKLPCPTQSADMISIKHLWAILDRKLCKRSKKPLSKIEYLRLLHETGQEVPRDDIRGLISRIPKRLLGLKNANLMSTKY